MSWFILVVAGLFEVGWAVGLKYSDGLSRPWPAVGTVLCMLISMSLLGVALKSLPLGTAYAVWVGIGVVGTAAVGMLLFDETASLLSILSLLLIVAGIAGLKLAAQT